jgi:hypothetical protein
MWVKMVSSSGVQAFVGNRSSSDVGWVFYSSSGKATAIFYGGSSSSYQYRQGAAFSVGYWTHLVMTKAAGPINTTTLNVYTTKAGESTPVAATAAIGNVGTMGSVQNSDKLRIGNWNDVSSYNYGYQGFLENVGVWSKELSSTDVATLYGSSGVGVGVAASGVESGSLVAAYLCDGFGAEPATAGYGIYGKTLEDSSGNDLTMVEIL